MTEQQTLADLRESAEALLKRPNPNSTANLLYQLIVKLHEDEDYERLPQPAAITQE